MPHTIRNEFDKHLTIKALLDAHERACKTKRYSREVLKFEIDLETTGGFIHRGCGPTQRQDRLAERYGKAGHSG